ICLSLIALITSVGNIIVVLAFYFDKKLRTINVNFAPGIWLISVITSDYRPLNGSTVTSECLGDYNYSFIYMLFAQFNYFIWPFIVLFILNILIMWNIWQRTRKMTNKIKSDPPISTQNQMTIDKPTTKEIKNKDNLFQRRSSEKTIILINDKHTTSDQEYCCNNPGTMLRDDNDSYFEIEDECAGEREYYSSAHNTRRLSTVDKQFLALPIHKQHRDDNERQSNISIIPEESDFLDVNKLKMLSRRASNTIRQFFGKLPITSECSESARTCNIKPNEMDDISFQTNNHQSNGKSIYKQISASSVHPHSPLTKKAITKVIQEDERRMTN
ncbi:unnamed protein product, partial [Didymodactylos carnosus]